MYRQSEYGASEVVTQIAKNSSGLIYAACTDGIIEFDGEHWRKIISSNETMCLGVDSQGVVFYGGLFDVGLLHPLPDGGFRHLSLRNELPEADREIHGVIEICATTRAVVFIAHNCIFRWSYAESDPEDGEMEVLFRGEPNTFIYVGEIDGAHGIFKRGEGLFRLISGELHAVPMTSGVAEHSLKRVLPLGNDAWLLVTHDAKLFTLDHEGLRPLVSRSLDEIASVTGVTALHSGDFMLATGQRGLVSINAQGEVQTVLDVTSGLPVGPIWDAPLDDGQGGLWAPTSSGIAFVHWPLSATVFDHQLGLMAQPGEVMRASDDLYVGSFEGLFVLDQTGDGTWKHARFRKVLDEPCLGIESHLGGLLVVRSDGIHNLDASGELRRINSEETLWICVLRDEQSFIAHQAKHGLRYFTKSSEGWTPSPSSLAPNGIRSITLGASSDIWFPRFESDDRWFLDRASTASGALELLATYGSDQGVPQEEFSAVLWNDRIHLLASSGLFRLQESLAEFEKISELPAFAEDLAVLMVDSGGSLWCDLGTSIAARVRLPDTGGSWQVDYPVQPLQVGSYKGFYLEPDGSAVWTWVDDGRLIRCEHPSKRALPELPQPRILGRGEDLLPSGVILENASRSVHFEFALPLYETPNAIHYQWRLLGGSQASDQWSEWSRDSNQSFVDLREGSYEFEVKGRDNRQRISHSAKFRFVISPPWYRTLWAYSIYAALAGTFSFCLVRLRLRTVRATVENLKSELVRREEAEELREAMRDQLQNSQRLESMGRLAGGVAHDFNNILMAIRANAELARTYPGQERQGEFLKAIEECSLHATDLTSQLLAFSRQQHLHPRVVDLNTVLTGLEPMLRRLIPENVEFTIKSAPETLSVLADSAQLEQVVMNLVLNARDAMPDGGNLTVETRWIPPASHQQESSAELVQGQAQITVSDTGKGIEQDHLAHIFEPFFTTKEDRKGTGLGLASVQGIVAQSGGRIDVKSKPGLGSVLKVFLPICTALPKEHKPQESPTIKMNEGSESVLVCDDFEPILKTIRLSLEMAGYEVAVAKSPGEALALAEKGGSFDLLLTDVIMPQMSGPELARRLRSKIPDLPVLFVSGYTSSMGPEVEMEGRSQLLEKPFASSTLLERVHSILN